MQAPKEIIQNKNTYNILQQPIWLAPQQQLLVLGMNMKIIYNNLYIFCYSSSRSLLFEHCV